MAVVGVVQGVDQAFMLKKKSDSWGQQLHRSGCREFLREALHSEQLTKLRVWRSTEVRISTVVPA
jgi:hypothetical protein